MVDSAEVLHRVTRPTVMSIWVHLVRVPHSCPWCFLLPPALSPPLQPLHERTLAHAPLLAEPRRRRLWSAQMEEQDLATAEAAAGALVRARQRPRCQL
eukprot:scaffold5291_cov188-Prasinococcus_capsulatus_cf.AAC.2